MNVTFVVGMIHLAHDIKEKNLNVPAHLGWLVGMMSITRINVMSPCGGI